MSALFAQTVEFIAKFGTLTEDVERCLSVADRLRDLVERSEVDLAIAAVLQEHAGLHWVRTSSTLTFEHRDQHCSEEHPDGLASCGDQCFEESRLCNGCGTDWDSALRRHETVYALARTIQKERA